MLKALISARNISTGKWIVDRRGYIDDTQELPAYFDEKHRPIDLEKYEVKLAIVTDDNWDIHTPSTTAQT